MTRTMKDSGVEWIGQIPERWNVIRNKYLMTKVKIIKQIYEQEPILSLTMNGVIKRDLDNPTGKMPTTFDGYQILKPNNLLMCLFDIDVTPRCIGIINEYGLSSPAYSQFVLNNKLNTRYAYYYYLNLDFTKELLHLAKNLRHSLTEEQLGYVPVPLPPLPEQQAIANYLDDKCAQIDNITATINEQIEVLKQYKKSVITEAVTKGLDHNVPMKDSGVEWIGRIPEHWEVKKLKFMLNESVIRSQNGDEMLLSVSQYKGIIPASLNKQRTMQANSLVGYKIVKKGNLVFNKLNPALARFGASQYDGITSPDFSVYIVNPNITSAKYLEYLLKTSNYALQLQRNATGVGEGFMRLYSDKLYEIKIALPNLTEQNDILNFVNDKCSQIDAVIADKQAQLETLAAYKKSLIYEYVTGKKSVPGFEEA